MKAFHCAGLFIGIGMLAPRIIAAGPCPSGKVLDEARHPILKAAIFVNDRPAGMSGADGEFQIKCEGITPPATIRIETPDEIPFEAQWTGAPLPEEIILKADDALRGSVLSRTGVVAGAKVELFAAADALSVIMRREKNGAALPLASTVAGAGGHFRLAGQTAGNYRLLVSAQGFVSLLSAPLKYHRGKWQKQSFTIERESTVAGIVTAAGKPAAGVPVIALVAFEALVKSFQNPNDALPFYLGRNLAVKSDALGRYSIAGLPAGVKLMLLADTPEFAPSLSAEYQTGDREPPALLLGIGGTLTGHLRSKDGAALKNPEVRASAGFDPQRWFSLRESPGERKADLLTPDANGIPFRMPLVATGKPALSARATGFIPVKNVAIALRETATAEHDFILEPGWVITGSVLDPDGKLIDEGRILVEKPEKSPVDFSVKVEEIKDGHFEVSGLTQPVVDLRLIADGYGQVRVKGVDARTAAPLRIILARSARVTGRVVTEAGDPVGEFTLRAEGEGFMQPVNVVSDDGYFTVPLPLEESRSVSIHSDLFAPVSINELALKPGASRDLGVITLKPGLSIAGKVMDEQGVPVAGAKLSASARGEWHQSFEAQSDAAGAFSLAGLTPGNYRLRVQHSQFSDATAEFTLDPQKPPEPLQVKMKRGLNLVVEVRDEQGAPSAGEIIIGMAKTSDRLIETSPGRYEISGLPPGKTFLIFAKPPAFSRSVEIVAGQDNRLAVRRGQVKVSGTIRRGSTPAAVESVIFQLAMADDDRFRQAGAGLSQPPMVTDASGKYHGEVPAGEYTVDVAQAHKRVSLIADSAAVIDLDIPDQGIKGCVVGADDKKPLPGVEITLMTVETYSRTESQTDATGCYHFDGVASDEYRITAKLGGIRGESKSIEVKDHTVEVPTIELRVGTGRIAGRLLTPGGGRFEGFCPVELVHGEDSDTGGYAKNGAYEILSLPAGDYIVSAQCSGKAAVFASVSLSIAGGMSVTQDFTLKPEAVIRVTLLKSDGTPVLTYFANATPSSPDCPGTRASGYASERRKIAQISGLAACEYEVTGTDPATKQSAKATIRVGEGETHDLELKLAP